MRTSTQLGRLLKGHDDFLRLIIRMLSHTPIAQTELYQLVIIHILLIGSHKQFVEQIET